MKYLFIAAFVFCSCADNIKQKDDFIIISAEINEDKDTAKIYNYRLKNGDVTFGISGSILYNVGDTLYITEKKGKNLIGVCENKL